jgi:hypothetical protein
MTKVGARNGAASTMVRDCVFPRRYPCAFPRNSARSAWRAITQMLAFVAKTFFD